MKNFLEWYKDTDINVIQTGFMKCEHKPDLNKVADFYNTPFKPELITELFEGWEYGFVRDKTDEFGNYAITEISQRINDVNVCFHFDSNSENLMTIFFNTDIKSGEVEISSREEEFYKPLTLNDFISDCSRAGISLELKAEIKEKYGLH